MYKFLFSLLSLLLSLSASAQQAQLPAAIAADSLAYQRSKAGRIVQQMRGLSQQWEQLSETDSVKKQQIIGKLSQLNERLDAVRLDYIEAHPDREWTGSLLLQTGDSIFEAHYKRLEPAVLSGHYGQQLKSRMADMEHIRQTLANASAMHDGMLAPDFTLTDQNGQQQRLSDRRGKTAVVLDFWGTWCYWCVKGLPEMKQALQRTGYRVEMISISCNDREDAWRKMIDEKGMYWTQLRNATGPDATDVALLYGVTAFPTKIIIGDDGRILGRFEGEVPEFYAMLDSLYAPQLPATYEREAVDQYLYSRMPMVENIDGEQAYLAMMMTTADSLLADRGWGARAKADMAIDIIRRYTSGSPESVLKVYQQHSQHDAEAIRAEVEEACRQQVARWQQIYPGQPAPDIETTDLKGRRLSLKSLRGKTCLIDIWGTWCVPCIEEMPNLRKLHDRYAGRDDVAIVSIACDKDRSRWTNFLDKHDAPWTQLLATPKGNSALDEVYGVIGIPRFIVIDREGRIVTADAMRPSEPEFDKWFESVIGK